MDGHGHGHNQAWLVLICHPAEASPCIMQVFERENKRCNLGILTHLASLFILTLPHLAVAAAFSAVAFIPMVDLNQSGQSLQAEYGFV